MASIERRIERLEAAAGVDKTPGWTVADWRSWRATGEPEPPAEILEKIMQRRAETAETLEMFGDA